MERVRWEYMIVSVASWQTAQRELAALGHDGWELVSLVETPAWRAVLKRRSSVH